METFREQLEKEVIELIENEMEKRFNVEDLEFGVSVSVSVSDMGDVKAEEEDNGDQSDKSDDGKNISYIKDIYADQRKVLYDRLEELITMCNKFSLLLSLTKPSAESDYGYHQHKFELFKGSLGAIIREASTTCKDILELMEHRLSLIDAIICEDTSKNHLRYTYLSEYDEHIRKTLINVQLRIKYNYLFLHNLIQKENFITLVSKRDRVSSSHY
jgi:hypothetical protein